MAQTLAIAKTAQSWQCPTCRKIWCEGCQKKVGRVFRKLVCPECEIEMKKGGLESVKKSMYG